MHYFLHSMFFNRFHEYKLKVKKKCYVSLFFAISSHFHMSFIFSLFRFLKFLVSNSFWYFLVQYLFSINFTSLLLPQYPFPRCTLLFLCGLRGVRMRLPLALRARDYDDIIIMTLRRIAVSNRSPPRQ